MFNGDNVKWKFDLDEVLGCIKGGEVTMDTAFDLVSPSRDRLGDL